MAGARRGAGGPGPGPGPGPSPGAAFRARPVGRAPAPRWLTGSFLRPGVRHEPSLWRGVTQTPPTRRLVRGGGFTSRNPRTLLGPRAMAWRSALEVKGCPSPAAPPGSAEPSPAAGTAAGTGQEKVRLPHATSAPPFREFCAGQEPAPGLPAHSAEGAGGRGPSPRRLRRCSPSREKFGPSCFT